MCEQFTFEWKERMKGLSIEMRETRTIFYSDAEQAQLLLPLITYCLDNNHVGEGRAFTVLLIFTVGIAEEIPRVVSSALLKRLSAQIPPQEQHVFQRLASALGSSHISPKEIRVLDAMVANFLLYVGNLLRLSDEDFHAQIDNLFAHFGSGLLDYIS